MPRRHVECRTCKVLGPEDEVHNIPTYQADKNGYVDGYYCEAHGPAAVEAARSHIAGLDLEDDARDDMMPLVLLIALLRARGLMSESLAPGEAQGEGMERVRNEALALLSRLPATRLPIVEPSALCSACFKTLPASQIRVIPWHNETAGDFVTTFRCGGCVSESLADTRARVTDGDARVLAQLGEFLRRHAVHLHEYLRGDPPEVVRPLMLRTLQMIEDGDIVLAIGETVPLKEALAARQAPPAPAPPAAPAAPQAPVVPSSPPSAESPAPPPPSLWQRIRRLFGGN